MALTSGQLAKKCGVGVETLRFYEREGLLAKPARSGSGYRQYPAEAVDRVRFIRRAQLLGFQLKDIKELLALRGDPDADSGEVREKAVAKLADIDQKITDLEAMKAELTRLVAACDGAGPAAHCSILAALGDAHRPA
jgi:MerR family mercuric resistance operon transcriptional regulator